MSGGPASGFPDYFSGDSSRYAAFRPRYPDALFGYLASIAPARRLAWDCATGTGQAAIGLADRFERVEATDGSAAQIAAATPHPRVRYRVALASVSGLEAGSVDLVTVAQALHWFPLPAFYAEARRVLRPGGVIAVWCYTRMRIAPAIDELVDEFHDHIVGPYWTPERRLVEEGYATIEFPFDELDTPAFTIEQPMTLDGLAGYLHTWSAVRRCRESTGRDPLGPFLPRLAERWGDPAPARPARWPLALRAGRTATA